MLLPEPGAIYVMDRGYVDFARLYALASGRRLLRHPRQVESRCPARLFARRPIETHGVISDQTIALDGYYHQPALSRTSAAHPLQGPRDRQDAGVPHQSSSPCRPRPSAPSTRAAGRWSCFFKWIKQHLRIKRFYGISENAVKTQIWIAVSVYVLVAIVKKRLELDASLYTLLQILSVTVFEKMPIQQAFSLSAVQSDSFKINNQLTLFDF